MQAFKNSIGETVSILHSATMLKAVKGLPLILLPLALYAGDAQPNHPSIADPKAQFPVQETAGLPVAAPVGDAPRNPGNVAAKPAGAPLALQGAGFTIDPYVVAGGGGSSTGGGFTLDGTIGQPAAGGDLTGGTFSLNSGFWPSTSSTSGTTKKRGGQLTSQ